MAANLSLIKTYTNELSTYVISIGQFIYCTDSKRTFYDVQSTVRLEIEFTLVNAYEELTPNASVLNMVYCTESDNKFYKYDINTNTFIELTTPDEVGELYDVYKLTPFTIEAPINGVKLAPRTLASSVYTSTGETVEEALQMIYKTVRIVTDVPVTEPYQKDFEINIPFEGYFENGNILDVYLNGILLDSSDYTIESNIEGAKLILDSSIEVHPDDALKYNFIYNSLVNNQDEKRIVALDAEYLANGSISTKKLKNISDSTNLDDSTSVASSKAVYDVHASLLDKINSATPMKTYLAKVSNVSTTINIVATATDFDLVDGVEVIVRMNSNMGDKATINISGNGDIPILVNGTTTTSKLVKNEVVSMIYNANANTFDVKIADYKVVRYNYNITTTANKTTVDFVIPKYILGVTPLTVYQNNLRLFEGVNYILKGNKIELINYTTEENDLFYFEIEKIERVI